MEKTRKVVEEPRVVVKKPQVVEQPKVEVKTPQTPQWEIKDRMYVLKGNKQPLLIFTGVQSDRVLPHHSDDLVEIAIQNEIEYSIYKYDDMGHTQILYFYEEEYAHKTGQTYTEEQAHKEEQCYKEEHTCKEEQTD